MNGLAREAVREQLGNERTYATDFGEPAFAIGDVRAGSVKRVAAAVGEGAAVVAQLHALLAERATPQQ